MPTAESLQLRLLTLRLNTVMATSFPEVWRNKGEVPIRNAKGQIVGEEGTGGAFKPGSDASKKYAEELRALGEKYAVHDHPAMGKAHDTLLAKAEKHAAGKTVGAKVKTTAPAPKRLVPVTSAGEVNIGRDDKPSAYVLLKLYGASQLHDAVEGYTHATLKDMAAEVMARNPGTKPTSMANKSALVDYIAQHAPGSERATDGK